MFGRPHRPQASDGIIYTCAECGGHSDFTHLCQVCRVGEYGEHPLVGDECSCPACISDVAGLVPCMLDDIAPGLRSNVRPAIGGAA